MTRFERDLKDALEGNEIEVLERRKAELDRIYKEGKCCKNEFRLQFFKIFCIFVLKGVETLNATCQIIHDAYRDVPIL